MISDLPIGARLRSRMVRDVVWGFRTHPLLTLALVIAVSVAVAAAAAALVVAAVLAAIVLAAVFVAYGAARELLQPGSADAAGRHIDLNGDEPALALRFYLAAVDEFARLTDVAVSIGLEEPPRGKAFR